MYLPFFLFLLLTKENYNVKTVQLNNITSFGFLNLNEIKLDTIKNLVPQTSQISSTE